MNWWRARAARSCSLTSLKVLAPPRWYNARARAGRERRRCHAHAGPGAAGLARSGHLAKSRGFCCRPDRTGAAMVDLAGRHFRDRMADRGAADAGFPTLCGIAEASDLRAAGRAVRTGCRRDAMVGRILECAPVCRRTGYQAPDAAAAVLSF